MSIYQELKLQKIQPCAHQLRFIMQFENGVKKSFCEKCGNYVYHD